MEKLELNEEGGREQKGISEAMVFTQVKEFEISALETLKY